jgi:hypothetical protein
MHNTFFVGESDVANYVGKSVNLYLKEVRKNIDYECIAVMDSGIGAELTVDVAMITDGLLYTTTTRPVTDPATGVVTNVTTNNWNNELDYFESKDATRTTKIYVADDPIVKINGAIVTGVTDLLDPYFTNVVAGSIENANRKTLVTFTENDNDKYYDVIDIQVLNYAIVESVLADKSRIEFADGTKMIFDFDDDEQVSYFYNGEGAEIAFEDIAEGDVLAIEIGEIDSTTNRPVGYNVFETKATVYDLGQSIVNGTVTGWDHDTTDNTGILYIDGTEYDYNANFLWVTDSGYSDLVASGDPLGVSGAFYLGMNGEIIGWDGSQSISGEYGFIVQTYWNTTNGFTNQYQVQILTAEEGIVTYNVDTTCEINVDAVAGNPTLDYKYVAENATGVEGLQSAVLDANNLNVKFNKNIHSVADRFVKYELNNSGEIDELYFVQNMTTANDYVVNANTEFKAATGKLGNRTLENEVLIFDVKAADVKNAKVSDFSVLVDEGTYAGHVFDLNKDKEMEFFVMTDGAAAFDPEANLLVVDSKTQTTYGDDAEEAVMIKYYTEGTNELLEAVFTEDSVNALAANVEAYKNLAKGSVLVANVAEDGFVVEYAVVANVNGGAYASLAGNLNALTGNIFGSNEVGTGKQDKAEFVYGYISKIKGKTLTLGGTAAQDFDNGRDFVIDADTAQYTYSTEGLKARVVVGDYVAKGVDSFDAGVAGDPTKPAKANLVLLKVYDDEVTDIISFSNRVTLANGAADLGILGQTHFTGPVADLNAADEVEVEVKAEEVSEEVEEIVFE